MKIIDRQEYFDSVRLHFGNELAQAAEQASTDPDFSKGLRSVIAAQQTNFSSSRLHFTFSSREMETEIKPETENP